jgi:hypothetical protein
VTHKVEPSYSITIHIAGDHHQADRSLRRQCFAEGLCVTLTPTRFIYTAGAEEGVSVGLVNYPPVPEDIEGTVGAGDPSGPLPDGRPLPELLSAGGTGPDPLAHPEEGG